MSTIHLSSALHNEPGLSPTFMDALIDAWYYERVNLFDFGFAYCAC